AEDSRSASAMASASPLPSRINNGATTAGSGSLISIQGCAPTSVAPGAVGRAAVTSACTAGGTKIRAVNCGRSPSWPMRARAMSGLLSAMIIPSEGTQFGLNLLVVQVHDRHLEPAQFTSEEHAVQPSKFGCFPERELSDFEKTDGKLEFQFPLN